MKIRKNLVHEESKGYVCETPSKTQTQFTAECDVNNIIYNYTRTGVLMHMTNRIPIYGDFSEVPQDYAECLATVAAAQDNFASLPSNIRDRFGNDPKNLLAFLNDSGNREEAVKLGLVDEVKE